MYKFIIYNYRTFEIGIKLNLNNRSSLFSFPRLAASCDDRKMIESIETRGRI